MKMRIMLSILICLSATAAVATNFTDLPDNFVPTVQAVDQDQTVREQSRDFTIWTVEADMLDLYPNLTWEGFDNTLVELGQILGAEGMISSTTDDICYVPGAIAEGFELGAVPENSQYAVVGEQAFGNFTPWVGPNNFADDMVIRFDPPVAAFGTLFQMVMVAADVNIEFYGASGLIGTDTIFAAVNTYWGVSIPIGEMITEITFNCTLGEPKLIDYIWFGGGEVVATDETTLDQLKSLYR